MNDLDLCVDAV